MCHQDSREVLFESCCAAWIKANVSEIEYYILMGPRRKLCNAPFAQVFACVKKLLMEIWGAAVIHNVITKQLRATLARLLHVIASPCSVIELAF